MADELQNTPQTPDGTSNSPQGADEYSTPIPQGATDSATPAQDDYSTPIPQGATDTPTQPKTGLQNIEDDLTGANETDPSWQSPDLGGMLSGAVKSGAGALGGILDMLTKGTASPSDAIAPKIIASAYKAANPGASPQQVAAYVNNIINNPHNAPPKELQEVSDWLHSGGQPTGFWENIGALGEQAIEMLGTDGLLRLTTAPVKAVGAGEAISQVADTAAHIKQAGTAASFLKVNPKIAGLITVGLKAAKDALMIGGQNYVHNQNPREALEAAALGGAVAAPIHALGEVAGNVANEAEKLQPKGVELNVPNQTPSPIEVHNVEPGETVKDVVPVGATHPELPEPTSTTGKLIKGAATKKGAFDFTQEQVQPAAVKATQDNFADVAKNAVDDLHDAQGVEHPDPHPVLNTVDETAKYMKSEAQKTYQKLDAAAQPDVDAWEAQYGKNAPKGNPNVNLLGPTGEPTVGDVQITPTTAAGEPIPEKPKLFTELQDQINAAKETIKASSGASQVDREAAIKSLPEYEQEMNDFLDKHSDVVNDGELDEANSVYSKGLRFDWIADKIRQATKGAGAGSIFKGDIQSLSPKSLENLPRQFDTQFGGDGAFQELLGSKGYRNYNDVVNTLKTPKTGDLFFDWLKSVPFGFGKILGTIPAGALADKILFDPEVGGKIINGFRKFEMAAHAAAKAPGVAASATALNKPKVNPLAALSSDLGGK